MNPRLAAIILGFAILLWLIVKYGNRLISNIKEREFLDKNKSLEQAAKDKKQKPSHNLVEYEAYAAKIQSANKPWYEDDDEQSVGVVFQNMHNELDISSLIKAFGIKDGMALAGYLYDFLDAEEIEQYVNAPMRGNGLVFQF